MTPVKETVKPLLLVITQPLKSITSSLLLYSSSHSSALLAAVPPQATSLITTAKGAAGVGDGVGVVEVGVNVGVRVGVGVGGKTPSELGCPGVPLRGVPLASWPFRVLVSLLCQLVSASGRNGSIRSILR